MKLYAAVISEGLTNYSLYSILLKQYSNEINKAEKEEGIGR